MNGVFSSWKEIANYLGKGVRTVQRWERERNLPVHRPARAGKGIVLAYADEIESWVKKHQEAEPPANQQRSARIRARELGESLQKNMAELDEQTVMVMQLTQRARALAARVAARKPGLTGGSRGNEMPTPCAGRDSASG